VIDRIGLGPVGPAEDLDEDGIAERTEVVRAGEADQPGEVMLRLKADGGEPTKKAA